ncbi:MAG: hypothetical protein MHM6MM_003207, partial [Cercozoa sp. M6MM]
DDGETKSLAVCTLRSTPSQPLHCIVWAKHAFALLFGRRSDRSDNVLLDEDDGGLLEQGSDESGAAFALRVVKQFFVHDAQRQRDLKEDWSRYPFRPTPLCDGDVTRLSEHMWPRVLQRVQFMHERRREDEGYEGMRQMQAPRDVVESLAALCDAVSVLAPLWRQSSTEDPELFFDKDFGPAMQFVAAAANLRMFVFGMTRLSSFAIKGIAGNIVHAVASTNATVAALQALDASLLLRTKKHASCGYFTIDRNERWPIAVNSRDEAARECPACDVSLARLSLRLSLWSFRAFRDRVLMQTCQCEDDASLSVSRGTQAAAFVDPIDLEDDDELDINLTDRRIGMRDGSFVTVFDDTSARKHTFCLVICDDATKREGEFELSPVYNEALPLPSTAAAAVASRHDDDDKENHDDDEKHPEQEDSTALSGGTSATSGVIIDLNSGDEMQEDLLLLSSDDDAEVLEPAPKRTKLT